MKGTGFIYIFILAAALLSGCIDSLQVGENSTSGESTLTLHISGDPQTRAPLSSTEDNVIQTLGVWLVDATGTIIQYKSTAPSATSTTVEFTTVPRGEHKLYIVANYEGLTGLASTYAVGKNISGIENVELKEISNATAPEFTSANGVTSSLIKEVVVSPGNNVVEAHLLRAVGRLTVTFRNGTENRDLFVGSVGLSKKNPSRGYLFGKDDHSNPPATSLLNFPDLTNVIKIGPGSESVVYDTYLYESTPAISGDVFKMGFTTGMYDYPKEFQAGMFVEGGTISGYKPGDNTKSISSTETWYMIRSVSSMTYYLADDNGLKLVPFTSDNEIPFDDAIKKYCWTFSATSGNNVRIKNVGTKKEITLSSSSAEVANNGNDLNISYTSNGELRFSREIQENNWWGGWSSTYYYLQNDANSPKTTTNTSGNNINWVLRPVTQTTIATGKHFVGARASTTNSETYDLKYIDMYGVAQNLEHICRNEHVNLTVNVYHHVATGGFVFEVEKWSDVSNKTTFD